MGPASFWLPAPACHRRSRCSAVQAKRLIGAKLMTSARKPAKRAVETLLGEVLGLVTPGCLIAPELFCYRRHTAKASMRE
jgi:hypothetical protein